jgi:glucan-binding YG repeat protein
MKSKLLMFGLTAALAMTWLNVTPSVRAAEYDVEVVDTTVEEDNEAVVATAGDAQEEPKITEGWHETEDGVWSYYDENGEQVAKAAGWYYFNSVYHYLKADGTAVNIKKGFHLIDGKYLYLNTDGTVVNKAEGWYLFSGKYHYLLSNGHPCNITVGFHYVNGKYIYMKADGSRVAKAAGWYYINSKYHYLKADGTPVKLTERYYYIMGSWRYLKSDGKRAIVPTGWNAINGSWYFIRYNGEYFTGWKTISNNKYYFSNYGRLSTGFFKASNGYYYYQTKNKGIYYNSILKNTKNGNYYYVGPEGKVINNDLTKLIINIYNKQVTAGMTKEQQLYAMYMYLATYKNSRFTYERRYDDKQYIGKGNWTYDYAYYLLSKKKGNCYRFACSFAYMARMLGYDSYVLVGECPSYRGGYTPHSIVMIKKNGTNYYYDPELQFANGGSRYGRKVYNSFRKGTQYKLAW